MEIENLINSNSDWFCKEEVIISKLSFPNTRIILEKLNEELTANLDKISRSEKMINSSMSDIGEQYKSQSE